MNNNSDKKAYLPDLTRDELESFMEDIGEKPYRGRQVFGWIHKKQCADFRQMTDLSGELQSKLENCAVAGYLTAENELRSDESGTRKFLFSLHDRLSVETVFMPEGKRRTICISSQVGCALKCSFCATGKMGFIRNLSAGEIVEQVLAVTRITGEKPTNIVFMGMGEPFHNYENAIKAADIINDDNGLAIGARHITISTVGLVEKMERYFREKHKYKLAVSLSAGREETRQKIIPSARKYTIQRILNTIRKHYKKRSRPVTLEYVILKDVNDSPEEIDALINMVSDLPVKVNLIPHNPVSQDYDQPDSETVEILFQRLRKSGIQVNVRWSKGTDISAACGQLYSAAKS